MRQIIASILLMSLAACGCSRPSGEHDQLTGLISIGSEPVKNVTIVATNAKGEEASALADEAGQYRMENPPKGTLKFKIVGFAPPPPPPVPGEPVVVVPINKQVPNRYHSSNNDLQFEFTGGKQAYDIHLTK
jgi:hypothetical protein